MKETVTITFFLNKDVFNFRISNTLQNQKGTYLAYFQDLRRYATINSK